MIVFLDLETTGLNEREAGICQIGAVAVDSQRNHTFFRACHWHGADISPAALEVNGETLASLGDPKRLPENLAVIEFLGFLRSLSLACGKKIQFAGWNVHFDFRFLQAALDRARVPEEFRPFTHRLLDVHSIAAAALMVGALDGNPINDVFLRSGCIANADICSRILHAAEEAKPHNALAGAQHAYHLFGSVLAKLTLFPAQP